ncbi:MAG: hypothetical protein KDN20_03850 [Verrucomicrobiae bacterium]|nr:hypothetical protein [Verrucomicrobiae bacterium]
MSLSVAALESELERSPEDWSVRLRLLEATVRAGDMDGARRLIRESPDESPLPYELQYRVHTLLTQGAAALGDVEEEGNQDPKVEEVAPADPPASQERTLVDPAECVPAKRHHPTPVPAKKPKESQPEMARESSPKSNRLGVVRLDLKALREEEERRRKEYDGDLKLTSFEAPTRRERQAYAAQKVSAFSFALLLHFILVVLVGFIVVAVPRPNPPQLIATVTTVERDTPIVPPRITRADEKKPAAASAAAPNVIGAIGASPVTIPEMETTNAVDVTSLITGMADAGDGISFAGDAREMSEVNFFGISAGGKRIVFIVDASPEMLVDEKGGMFAYDKVKNEIGVMLASLNRGTKFNILLYEGKRLMAFAEEPVTAAPSNLRLAVEWLSPLNRTYEELGLAGHRGEMLNVVADIDPIAGRDVAHYAKAVQKAIEWQASTVFCISGGYRVINRSPTPEDMEKFAMEREKNPGTPGEVSASDRAAWTKATQRTREWLASENAARAEKGLPPKVVTNFNALVQQITGASPPRASGGVPGARAPRMEPHTPEDIENLVKNGVQTNYRDAGLDPLSLHMVVFLGEDEDMNDQTRDHFKNLTRKNNGKFKMLRGLAALSDVTGGK